MDFLSTLKFVLFSSSIIFYICHRFSVADDHFFVIPVYKCGRAVWEPLGQLFVPLLALEVGMGGMFNGFQNY